MCKKLKSFILVTLVLFFLGGSIFSAKVELGLSYKVKELLRHGKKYQLILLGKPVVKHLVKYIKKGGTMARITAVSALGGIGDSNAKPVLKELIQRIQRKRKRVFLEDKLIILAAEALARCGSKHGIKILKQKLREVDERIVGHSASALSRVGGIDSVYLILDKIRKLNPKIENLFSALKLLYFRHRTDWRRNSELKDSLRDVLVLCLRSDVPRYRFSAAWLAGELDERRLANQLKFLLNDEDMQVRYQAAHSLCLLGDEKGVKTALLNLEGNGRYRNEKIKKEFRRSAARCLKNIRRKGMSGKLLNVLDEKDDVLVNNAIFSIYTIGNTKVLGELEKALSRNSDNSQRASLLRKTIKAFKVQNSYMHRGRNAENIEKITIKTRDIEVWRLFRMISKLTGQRIVLNPGVQGTITYSARDKHYLDVIRQIALKKKFQVIEKKNMIEIIKKKDK